MVDLSDYSFADWMNFVFNHPVDPAHPWYMADCVLYDFDSAVMLQHLSTLFARPELAYLIYTPEQHRLKNPYAFGNAYGFFKGC